VLRFRSSQTSVQQNDANFGIGTLAKNRNRQASADGRQSNPPRQIAFPRKGSSHEGHARHADDRQHCFDRLRRVARADVPDDVRRRRRWEAAVGDLLEPLDFPRRRPALRVPPLLFLWLQWFRTALVAAAVPITWMIILAVVLFAFF